MDKAFKALRMWSSKMFHLCPYEPYLFMHYVCTGAGWRQCQPSSADGMMHEEDTRQAAPAHKGGVFQVVSCKMQHRWSTILTIVTTPRPGDKKHFTCHAAAPALRTLDTNTMDRNIIQQSPSTWLQGDEKKCPHHSPRLLSRASNEAMLRYMGVQKS